MHAAIQYMLEKYECKTEQEYVNALKEIFQEITLLALWRAKFYENAAFYGGSALRILHGLDRFSEDLDFTLLKPNEKFTFDPYNKAVVDELNAFGFDVSIETRIKTRESNIESAFLKADSKKQLMLIQAPSEITKRIHNMQTIKIKMEADINPPQKFSAEAKSLFQPIPFTARSLTLPDLFSGKIHALLCRPWQKRIKGRDWYDFVWYIGRKTPINLTHLQERLIQSKAWDPQKTLQKIDLIEMLSKKIQETDFENAKKDVLPFLKDPQSIDLWSKDFFRNLLSLMIL